LASSNFIIIKHLGVYFIYLFFENAFSLLQEKWQQFVISHPSAEFYAAKQS